MPAFLYPLKGAYYFFTHPKQLWLKTLSPILLTLIFSFFSIGVSIKFLLPHQVEKLLEWHWPHWMSWFVSSIAVVLESAILNLLFFAFLVGFFQDMIFDATLEAQGLGDLLDDTDDIPKLVLCWRNLRSSLLVRWVLIMVKIILLVVTAPLQLVPVAGTALACYINGWPTGWSQHLHYDIEIRGLTVKGSYKYAASHKLDYVNFGAVAFALEILPIFNIFFMWTNIVGAALWIADEYKEDQKNALPIQKKDGEETYPAAQAPSASNEHTPLLANQQ